MHDFNSHISHLYVSLFGITPLDKNIKFDIKLINWLIGYTAICWVIVFYIIITRMYQIIKTWEKSIKVKSLLFTHILMMFFYIVYLTAHLSNSIGFRLKAPIINCQLWYLIIVLSFWIARIFQWCFLLWRSYWTFKSSIMASNKRWVMVFMICHPILVIAMSFGTWFTATAFNVPNKGFCTRKFPLELSWVPLIATFYDVIIAFGMSIFFIYKAKTVTKVMFLTKIMSKSGNKARNHMFLVFQKHIILGILTCFGSIILFFSTVFLRMSVGFIAMADVVSNCLFIYLIFAENHKIYQVCCRCFEWYGEKRIEISSTKPKSLEIQITQNSNSSEIIKGHKGVCTDSSGDELDIEYDGKSNEKMPISPKHTPVKSFEVTTTVTAVGEGKVVPSTPDQVCNNV